MPDSMSKAQIVRTLRGGKTQNEFAELVGVSNGTYISRIEHGHKSPTLETLGRWAGIFGKKLQVHISLVEQDSDGLGEV